MKKLIKTLVLLVVLAGVGTGGYFAYQHFQASTKVAAKLITSPIARRDIAVYVTASGTIDPVVTVDVGSQISGRISALYADYNSEVTKGQVIAELDPILLKSQVTQAKANLEAAKAGVKVAQVNLSEAQRQASRTKALYKKSLVSKEENESAASRVQAAQAEVASAKAKQVQAEANLQQAEINLNYATITSPIDGVVIARSVDVGQTVAASLQAPTLFTLAEDLRKMEVHTSVSESDVAQIAAGTEVEFNVDAYPERDFSGSVKEVRYEAQTVQNVVTYDAVVVVDNLDLALRPGMTADVRFKTKQAQNVVAVPNTALRYRTRDASKKDSGRNFRMGPPGGMMFASNKKPELPAEMPAMPPPSSDPNQKFVWIERDGQPTPIPVKTGLTDGTFTEITESPEPLEGLKVITGEEKRANQGKR